MKYSDGQRHGDSKKEITETEKFISALPGGGFDYTEWRKRLVDSVDSFEKLDAMLDSSNEVAKFSGKAKVVL